ncbi:hypothetical protein CKAH01_09679 [Colletotrichum kahawae]|uniref:C2H2-type domain-containing protein n=1 Tax=Colletotrichum kahawae TaxID=34407 RepID=A0AAE0D008_COLKA|nr:hypothetical protein CKAH01_09679 [Colletotrichum kahawae]
MSSPTDNDYQDRVNNVTDLRECISGAREQIEIVRVGANRVHMWQQRGLELNRGVTRHEHTTTATLSEIEQEAHDALQNVQQWQNNLEGMDIDSSPSDGPSQSTTGSASPDPDPAPAAVPVAAPVPVAPVAPVAPITVPPVPTAPIPVAPANNLPRLTANQLCANAPALVARIPAHLQAQAVRESVRIVAEHDATARAAAAAAAASPIDPNLRAASEYANFQLKNNQGRQVRTTRVCVHCYRVCNFNDNLRCHLREKHYKRDPRYNHLNNTERIKVARAEAP